MNNPMAQAVDPFTYQRQADSTQKDVRDKLKDQIIGVFSNPHGLQLLETLEEMFVRQSVSPPGCPEGYGYFREGQNSLILKIRSIVNAAAKG